MWRRWILIASVTAGLTVVTGGGSALLGSLCRCRYTPVIYAERWGMKPIVIERSVPVEDRWDFVAAVEEAGALVDPDWKYGFTEGFPLVYAEPARRAVVRETALGWSAPR